MARTYDAAHIGWNHKGSSFEKEETANGQIRYHGIYMVGSIRVRFTLNSQRGKEKADYLWRGLCSVLSVDGYILQVEGDARRKIEKRLKEREADYVPGEWREELNATMALHCQGTSEDEIRAYIARSAAALCEKNMEAVYLDWVRSGKTLEATAMDAWMMFQPKFMKDYAKRSSGYQSEIRSRVQRVCAALSHLPMNRLTAAMVSRYASDMDDGKRTREDMEIASKFWDLCRRQRFCTGENPFAEWLERNRKGVRVNAAAALASVSGTVAFSQGQEAQIYGAIRDNWHDSQYRTLLLAFEHGLSAKEISGLRVGNLVFRDTPPRALIRRRKEHLNAATHNYTVPATPFCAHILTCWYSEFLAAHPGGDLSAYSVCGEGNKALPVKAIQDFCRRGLMQCGVAGSSGVGKRVPTFALLAAHVRYRLETYCGLRDEPGAVNYLLGSSPADDTTSDHYRNFADEEGQYMLYCALARDRRFYAEPLPTISEGIPGKEIWAVPAAPEERSVTSATIRVKAGDIITVESPMGVQVSWRGEKIS